MWLSRVKYSPREAPTLFELGDVWWWVAWELPPHEIPTSKCEFWHSYEGFNVLWRIFDIVSRVKFIKNNHSGIYFEAIICGCFIVVPFFFVFFLSFFVIFFIFVSGIILFLLWENSLSTFFSQLHVWLSRVKYSLFFKAIYLELFSPGKDCI